MLINSIRRILFFWDILAKIFVDCNCHKQEQNEKKMFKWRDLGFFSCFISEKKKIELPNLFSWLLIFFFFSKKSEFLREYLKHSNNRLICQYCFYYFYCSLFLKKKTIRICNILLIGLECSSGAKERASLAYNSSTGFCCFETFAIFTLKSCFCIQKKFYSKKYFSN